MQIFWQKNAISALFVIKTVVVGGFFKTLAFGYWLLAFFRGIIWGLLAFYNKLHQKNVPLICTYQKNVVSLHRI